MADPRYVNVSDDGYELDSESAGRLADPKWRTPTTKFQIRVLNALGMDKFPKNAKVAYVDTDGNSRTRRVSMTNRDARTELLLIEREMAPATYRNGKMNPMPAEYVEEMIQWAEAKRYSNQYITLPALVMAIRNPDNYNRFVQRWLNAHKDALEQQVEAARENFTTNVPVAVQPKKEEPKHAVEKINPYSNF